MSYFTQSAHRQSKPRGFTLIELLVSVALFTIVMTISVGTLLALVSANQKAQSLKLVINNLNFSLESMSRAIRTGAAFHCTNTVPSTLPTTTADCPNGGLGLVLTDGRGRRLAYRYNDTTRRVERKEGDSGPWIALTAPDIIIEEMRFYVTGTTQGDDVQPTATIGIRGHVGSKPDTDSFFNVQTTVTQRVLDE